MTSKKHDLKNHVFRISGIPTLFKVWTLQIPEMKKTALVTGASSGIGLELAKIHASKGDNLVIVSRNKNKLLEIKKDFEKEFKVSVYVIVKDLSVAGSAIEVYDEVKKQKIKVDYLINNAGMGSFGEFSKSEWDTEHKMIQLNVTSLTYFCKLFLKDMVRQGSGKIMNVASIAGFQPGPLMAVYFATKSYVLHFSEAIGNELVGKGVTVTALCPGPTISGFEKSAGMGESVLFRGKKLPSSREVALYGYESMMNGKAVAVHGWKNRLLINMSRFVPRSLVVKMPRRSVERG